MAPKPLKIYGSKWKALKALSIAGLALAGLLTLIAPVRVLRGQPMLEELPMGLRTFVV